MHAGATLSQSTTLFSVQYLRGVAALMIVVLHLAPRLERMGWRNLRVEWLSAGVDIFFVISGFIMWVTTAGRPTRPGQFMVRRAQRIIPLYYIFTVIWVGMMLVLPRLVPSGKFDAPHAIASFLFLPWPHPVDGLPKPALPQGWTLNYEMVFYLLFALALFLTQKARLWAMLGTMTMIVLAGALIPGSSLLLDFYASPIILEFVAGILLAVLYLSRRQVSSGVSMVMICLGVVGLILSGSLWPEAHRAIAYGVPALMIVGGCVFLDKRIGLPTWRVPKLLGDSSYSLYLSHGLALSGCAFIWGKLGLTDTVPAVAAYAVIAVASATLLGIAVYRWIESPIERRFRNRRARPGPAVLEKGFP
jgi:exopolysaccharide production protein ExoZ